MMICVDVDLNLHGFFLLCQQLKSPAPGLDALVYCPTSSVLTQWYPGAALGCTRAQNLLIYL